jgi:hypothetical protein
MHGICLNKTVVFKNAMKKRKETDEIQKRFKKNAKKVKDKCIYDNVDEYIEKSNSKNELDIFHEEFAMFKLKNNIAVFRDINEQEWEKVDKFILFYSLKMALEKKVKKVIMDYGIIKGYVRLIDFYKNECGVATLKNEQCIMNYIVCQGEDAIALDMVFAIFRDIVMTTGTEWW